MSDQPRDKGKFAPTVDLGDVLDVFDEVAPRQVTAADVADLLECSRETGRRKLDELVDRGIVGKGVTAGGVFLYWRK